MDDAVAALIGAGIGALGPILANILTERSQLKRKREQTCRAIAGEISALQQIILRRRYLDHVRDAEAVCKDGTCFIFEVSITQNYLPVVESSLLDIGLLPSKLPTLVPRYATFVKSCLEDFRAGTAGVWNDYTSDQLVNLYGQLATLIQDGLRLGDEIVALIDSLYPNSSG